MYIIHLLLMKTLSNTFTFLGCYDLATFMCMSIIDAQILPVEYAVVL